MSENLSVVRRIFESVIALVAETERIFKVPEVPDDVTRPGMFCAGFHDETTWTAIV